MTTGEKKIKSQESLQGRKVTGR